MGKAHSSFKLHQPAEAWPVRVPGKSHVSSGPFLGFLGWARPTGRRLPHGLRAMFHAGPSASPSVASTALLPAILYPKYDPDHELLIL